MYCQSKATPFDQVANEDNIGKLCTTSDVNKCLNDELMKLHNKHRLLHESPPLRYDDVLASRLQKELNINSSGFKEATELDLGTAPKYADNCRRNVYKYDSSDKNKDMKSLADATAADWYSGSQYYDYEKGDTSKVGKLKEYQKFARMIWAASTTAAFGLVHDKAKENIWVVGYYCYAAPMVDDHLLDISEIKKNVGQLCMVDGYNRCYNKRALERHNQWRESHSGFKPLVLDTGIAKAIQKQLMAKGFNGTIQPKDRGQYTNCGENVYVLSDQTKLSQVPLTNMATDFWYEGKKYWDVAAGTPKLGIRAPQVA